MEFRLFEVAPPEFGDHGLLAWSRLMLDWMIGLGAPLALGLVLLAGGLGLSAYFLVKAAWRIHLIRAWRRRPGRPRIA